jgi:hypothetical protein
MNTAYQLGCQCALQKLGGVGGEALKGALRGAGLGAAGGGVAAMGSGDPWDVARGAAIGAGALGGGRGMAMLGRRSSAQTVMGGPQLTKALAALKGKVGPERQAILQTLHKAHPTLGAEMGKGTLTGGVVGAAGGGLLAQQLVSKD